MFYNILFGNSNNFLYLCLLFARVGETLLPERKSKSLAAYITIQLQRKMEIITIIYYTMKHKYPRLLSVLCALMIATSASWAERVSQEDAALVAGNFMNAGDTTSQGA